MSLNWPEMPLPLSRSVPAADSLALALARTKPNGKPDIIKVMGT
jgi:hypothetical protein